MFNEELYNGVYVEDIEDDESPLEKEYYNRDHSGIFLYDMCVITGKIALYTLVAIAIGCFAFAVSDSV